MNRLIFVNRFYWPDEPATSQLLTDLAERIAAEGRAVQVLASRTASTPSRERHHGVDIIRVASTRFDHRSGFGRLVDLASFVLGAAWHLLIHVRQGDTCIFLTDPPMLAAVCWPWLTLRRARIIHWIQDIYPEIAIELTAHGWLRVFRPWRNLVWRHSSACITLGRDMAGTVARAGVPPDRIQIVPNWAPVGLKPATVDAVEALRRECGLTGKHVLLYAGNLGRVHHLAPILEAAALLRSEPDLTFVFVGHGPQLPALRAAVTSLGLENVRFLPPQPRIRLSDVLSLGDTHFVTLRPGCESLVFPSKLYGIAAVSRPVIFIGPTDCDLACQVATAGFGRVFAPDDIASLAQYLRALSRDPAARARLSQQAFAFAQTHTIDQAVGHWRSILANRRVLAGVPPARQAST